MGHFVIQLVERDGKIVPVERYDSGDDFYDTRDEYETDREDRALARAALRRHRER